MERDKKGRVKAGKKRELANVKNTLKKVGKSAVPSTLKLAATLPEHGKGKPTKRKELVEDVRLLLYFKGIRVSKPQQRALLGGQYDQAVILDGCKSFVVLCKPGCISGHTQR